MVRCRLFFLVFTSVSSFNTFVFSVTTYSLSGAIFGFDGCGGTVDVLSTLGTYIVSSVGMGVGLFVGLDDGEIVGLFVGLLDGDLEKDVGTFVGVSDGKMDGLYVGSFVGS